MRALRSGRTRIEPRSRAHRALGAVSWRTRCRVVAPLRLCRRGLLPCRCMHEHAVAPYRSSPVAIQKLYRDAKAHAARWAPYRSPCRACVMTQGPPSFHDTNNCIVTHPSGQVARVRCHSLVRRPAVSERPVARPSSCSAVSSPLGTCPAALCHNTICCIVT